MGTWGDDRGMQGDNDAQWDVGGIQRRCLVGCREIQMGVPGVTEEVQGGLPEDMQGIWTGVWAA